MSNNLRDKILNTCRGYEREHITRVLQGILDDNNPNVCRDRFNMKPCPVCGNEKVHITDIMNGTTPNPRVTGKMGVCTACNFKGPIVHREDKSAGYTNASWTLATINLWNEINMFTIMDGKYGKQYQYTLFHEETIELIEALFRTCLAETRYHRGDRNISDADIVSEMADVIICIYQWLHSTDISPDNLDIAIKSKLDHLCHNASVHSAAAGLSKKVTDLTTITSAHTADKYSQKH